MSSYPLEPLAEDLFLQVQKWAPAITVGNSFVLKPSPMTPLTSLRIFQAAFANTGQVCAAIKRVFVHEDIYPEFVAAVTAQAKAAVTGDGFSPGTEYGPLNNKMQFDKVRTVPPGRHRMR